MSTSAETAESAEIEEPLEIVDYSCSTSFDEAVLRIESFVRGLTLPTHERRSGGGASIKDDVPAHSGDDGDVGPVRETLDVIFEQDLAVVEFHVADTQHYVCRYFGTSTFLLIRRQHRLISIGEAHMLLSCLVAGVASSGSPHPWPCFTPTGDSFSETFVGFMNSNGFITRYSMAAEPHIPAPCSTVSGLLDLFHLNVGLQSRLPSNESILVDVMHEYVVEAHLRMDWSSLMANENEELVLSCGHQSVHSIGTNVDPIRELRLSIFWNSVAEQDVLDTSVMTSFDPHSNASRVQLAVRGKDKLEMVTTATETVGDMLRLYISSIPEFPLPVGSEKSPQRQSTPLRASAPIINAAKYDHMVEAIFSRKKTAGDTTSAAAAVRDLRDVRAIFPQKSIFAEFAAQCTELRSANEIYELWSLVVQQLRELIDGDISQRCGWVNVLGVTKGNPTLSACIMHQKLQLLQCCGEALRASSSQKGSGWDEDAELEGLMEPPTSVVSDAQLSSQPQVASSEAVPRSSAGDSLTLLSGVDMVIPPPRPPIPVTSDMLEMQEEALASLGTGKHAADARTWIQSSTLLADMCAFKYLNGVQHGRTVQFADFVHWYSPADFHETATTDAQEPQRGSTADDGDQNDGSKFLSLRMSEENNVWKFMWAKATPTLQETGFSAVEHLPLALKWLEERSKTEIAKFVLCYTVASTVETIAQHRCARGNPILSKHVAAAAVSLGSAITRLECELPNIDHPQYVRAAFKEVEDLTEDLEVRVAEAISLEDLLLLRRGDKSERRQSSADGDAATGIASTLHALSSVADKNVEVPISLWHSHIGDIVPPDAQPCASQYHIRGLLERPMNARPTNQFLRAFEDELGTFRVALGTTEQLP